MRLVELLVIVLLPSVLACAQVAMISIVFPVTTAPPRIPTAMLVSVQAPEPAPRTGGRVPHRLHHRLWILLLC